MNELDDTKQSFRPDHAYFFNLIDDAKRALTDIDVVTVKKQGIKELFAELRRQNIKPLFGSLRLDRDSSGDLFLQEYRPTKNFLRRGFFMSLDRDRPMWNNLGTLLIRLHKKWERQQSLADERSGKQVERYCLILQGSLDRRYIEILLEQGRFSFNTKSNHLVEEPIFDALAILERVAEKQIVTVKLPNHNNIEVELRQAFHDKEVMLGDIACVIGKDEKEDHYVAGCNADNHFVVHSCKYKPVPVEIARTIQQAGSKLIDQKRYLVLDGLDRDTLIGYLTEREKYYFENRLH